MADNKDKVPAEREAARMPSRAGSWAPFDTLRQEIDRLFDDFHPFGWGGAMPRSLFGGLTPRTEGGGWQLSPAIDVVEKPEGYEITAELPGLDEKDVEVAVAGGVLTIKGEKKEESEDRQKGYFVSERRYGSFRRSFQLPEGVDADSIEASFAKGVLTVKLPKLPEAQQSERKITVQSK